MRDDGVCDGAMKLNELESFLRLVKEGKVEEMGDVKKKG